MEFDLPVNESRTKTFTVQEHQIADFLGSGKVSVLSSPSMILMMEQTAMLFAQEYLPEEYITVGTRVDVSHLRASKLGAEITVNAKLIDFEKKHMVFVVEAFDGEHKIGEGKHERHIVNKEKFISRI
ncbi:MAG: thioesterase family protein [Candidatus Heimdallarchaeota archaeon]